jgi:outer membrane lipoprotein-sorting protein
VRLKFPGVWARLASAIVLFSAICLLPAVTPAAATASLAQNPDTMMPEQNVAKAREILNQLIDALGGPAYLEVRERECDGRRAKIGHSGEMEGYIDFKDFWRYPDKHRIDYSKKGNIIDLFTGDQGWTLDRSGVSEEPATAVSEFQALMTNSVDNLLRRRLRDPALNLHYAGRGIVDMLEADWVEVPGPDSTLRLAVARSTHLLLRSVVASVNQEMNERTEETTIYTNYRRKDGVMVAMQVSRERDGRRYYQAFYDTCTFNPNLPDDTFTRAALEKRYAEVGNKKDREKYKNARD